MRCFFTSDAQRIISLSICSLDEVSSTEGTPYKKLKEKLKTKGFLWRSRRRLRHQRGHDGGFRDGNHRVLKWYATGGSLPVGMPCERRCRCSRTDNQDSPSGKCGRLLSSNSRRMPCYGLRGEVLRSVALSASKLQGRWGHPLYPDA